VPIKEKDYMFTVTVTWNVALPATSKEEARNILIEEFAQEYNIDLTDDEIKDFIDESELIIKEEK